jgi:quercetin dioxygenase-like cupin family protein
MEKSKSATGFIPNESHEWERTGEGVRRKIMGYDKDVMMVIVEFQKGAEGYVHSHPHKQVSYVAKGSFEVNIDGEKKVLKAGDVFFVNPDLKHGVIALDEGTLIDVFSPYREDFLK